MSYCKSLQGRKVSTPERKERKKLPVVTIQSGKSIAMQDFCPVVQPEAASPGENSEHESEHAYAELEDNDSTVGDDPLPVPTSELVESDPLPISTSELDQNIQSAGPSSILLKPENLQVEDWVAVNFCNSQVPSSSKASGSKNFIGQIKKINKKGQGTFFEISSGRQQHKILVVSSTQNRLLKIKESFMQSKSLQNLCDLHFMEGEGCCSSVCLILI